MILHTPRPQAGEGPGVRGDCKHYGKSAGPHPALRATFSRLREKDSYADFSFNQLR